MTGIGKSFPGVIALQDVDLSVKPGEVHALMGENGAGKSTLIKVLTGIHQGDAGDILFCGERISPASAAQAQHAGISTIYQEVNLVPTLSVTENLLLGRAPRRWFGIDWAAARTGARELLADFDLDRQPVSVPTPFPFAEVAPHRTVAGKDVLDGPRETMARMR